jgi:Tol biopolymer transport system component
MTPEQIDALITRMDVPSTPDLGFVATSHADLVGRVRAARARDATWLGRLRRDLRAAMTLAFRPAVSRSVQLAGLVALLILALAIGLLIVGALNPQALSGNGLLVVSVKGQLQAIDPATGAASAILPATEKAEGVSRSPDGRIVTFWINGSDRSRLFMVGIDGRGRRELASGTSVTWNQSIDTWSSDSRFLATEVSLDGQARILVVNVATGAARLVTPAGVVAHNPLWSPDDQWIAFTPETEKGRGLSVIRTDGSGMHDVAGDMNGLDVAGPDTWTPDGEWIYFCAGSSDAHVFRANVPQRTSQQLTSSSIQACAVASSPDGSEIVFIVSAAYGWDLWIANSDGSGAHRLLESGGIGGWSTDGQFVLVRWKPADEQLGGLGTIRPDGTDLRILVPFDPSCRDGWEETCELGFGWGQARP